VVLEYGVKPYYLQIGVLEQAVRALRLRGPVSYATGAEHLKGMQENNAAAQACQRERLPGIEPLRYAKLGRQRESGFGHFEVLTHHS
jgi:hypothetical protein